MYPATPTFWLEPTDEVAWGLRRYAFDQPDEIRACAASTIGVHEAMLYLGRAPLRTNQNGRVDETSVRTPHDDPRWPTQCGHCDYRFSDSDRWQDWQERIWRRPSDSTEFVLHSWAPIELGITTAPPGATWDSTWMPDRWRGPDGISLTVRLPNSHDWLVDSEASNCTRKGEPHECWVRHGDPRDCHVTVDKNGDTCAAGAGSILAGDYHGFLQNGVLTAG